MIKVRTLFISDCHLGSDYCNHEQLLKLLSEVECEYLYIVGDFIDGWALSRKFKWHSNNRSGNPQVHSGRNSPTTLTAVGYASRELFKATIPA